MISFRFHVVSITAVFLAIAIGVVVGSTYVDRAIVDNLQNRIDTVSANLDDRKAENDQLEGSLDQARDYIAASAPFSVTERLSEVAVLVVATRGIDESAVEDTVALARRAGGVVPGVVWLEPAWSLDDAGDREAIAALVDAPDEASPDRLRAEAWEAVTEELTAADRTDGDVTDPALGGETTTTTEPPAAEVPVLTGLEAAGFLTVDSLEDESAELAALGGSGARVLVVTGPDVDQGLLALVPVVVDASVSAGLVTVAAEVFAEPDGGLARGQTLISVIEAGALEAIVLVDDLDRIEGQVAAVVGLGGTPAGGHFGYGPGADAVLPGWTPP